MKGTATVTMASKLSFDYEMKVTPGVWEEKLTPMGMTRVFVADLSRQQVFPLRGTSASRRLESNGNQLGPMPSMSGGYRLTPGVPADFCDQWLKENADLPAVKDGLIFAHSRESYVRAQAREKAELRSGMEAIDPSKVYGADGKIKPPKGSGPAVTQYNGADDGR
jgi:hypothetical protein